MNTKIGTDFHLSKNAAIACVSSIFVVVLILILR